MSDLLQYPPVVESSNGFLNITLTLEATLLTIRNDNDNVVNIVTRTFNDTLPGPTLVVSPGDTMNVRFINNLNDQGIPFRHNELSAPDESNLHWHGLHADGEAPSDDATLVIGPTGGSYDYVTTLPTNHLPGLHWYHPHRHGATALQVGGGAAGAIIVREDSSLGMPAVYRDAPHHLMVVQPILFRLL